jgi:glutathione S-transferase
VITVFGFSSVPVLDRRRSPELRLLWALEEMGLPYRIHALAPPPGDPATGAGEPDQADQADQVRSSLNWMQAIDGGCTTVSSSGACLVKLARKTRLLWSEDPAEQQQILQWCFAALSTVAMPATLLEALQIPAFGGQSIRQERGLPKQAHSRLDALNRWLADREFVATRDFTVADVLLTHELGRQEQDDAMFEAHEGVRAYRLRCQSRPSWTRALEAHRDRTAAA